jgi:hypothetical protein
MFTRILASAILAAGFSQAALAQSPGTDSPNASAVGTQSKQTLPQELRQKLTRAGYTDVKMVPSSFLVTAKNKSGNPVMMRITPHSMTMLTEIPVNGASGSSKSSSTSENTGSSRGSRTPSSSNAQQTK